MKKIFLMIFVLCMVLGYFITENISNTSVDTTHQLKELEKPDFSTFKDVKAKKAAFFDYFYPLIVNKNLEILALREEIGYSSEFNEKLQRLCEVYKTKCENNDYKALLKNINIIPPSLIMAQGANESAWGTSRFATKGNNFFGIWCFTKGCGIIPSGRDSGKSHEVRKFDTPKDSVSFYVDNINRNHNYEMLRTIREKDLDSIKLANGLLKYSEKGQVYVDEIIQMISYNKLKEYDSKMFNYLKTFKKFNSQL